MMAQPATRWTPRTRERPRFSATPRSSRGQFEPSSFSNTGRAERCHNSFGPARISDLQLLKNIAVGRSEQRGLLGTTMRGLRVIQSNVTKNYDFQSRAPVGSDLRCSYRRRERLGRIACEVMRKGKRTKPKEILWVERIELQATLKGIDRAGSISKIEAQHTEA